MSNTTGTISGDLKREVNKQYRLAAAASLAAAAMIFSPLSFVGRSKPHSNSPQLPAATNESNATVICTGGDNGSIRILRSQTSRIAAATSVGLVCK